MSAQVDSLKFYMVVYTHAHRGVGGSAHKVQVGIHRAATHFISIIFCTSSHQESSYIN